MRPHITEIERLLLLGQEVTGTASGDDGLVAMQQLQFAHQLLVTFGGGDARVFGG